jgi:hypothetical protein
MITAARFVSIAVLFVACKTRSDSAGPASTLPKCTRVGQTCEFGPNKLGSCVMRDNCSEDCLVCQSQH